MPLERQPPPAPAPSASTTLPLGFLRLTLDDVQDVLDYLDRRDFTPVLSAGFAIATDAASLKSATRRELRGLTIGSEAIAVFLYRGHAVVRYVTANDEARAAGEGVVRLLKARRVWSPLVWARLFLIVSGGALVLFGCGYALLAALGGGLVIERIDLVLTLVAVCGLLGASYATLIVVDNRNSGQAALSLTFRHERREVTLSLSRALAVGALTALVSGAAGALVTWALTAP